MVRQGSDKESEGMYKHHLTGRYTVDEFNESVS